MIQGITKSHLPLHSHETRRCKLQQAGQEKGWCLDEATPRAASLPVMYNEKIKSQKKQCVAASSLSAPAVSFKKNVQKSVKQSGKSGRKMSPKRCTLGLRIKAILTITPIEEFCRISDTSTEFCRKPGTP